MSRIGRQPIPLPSGVKYTIQGNTVLVEGPKGKLSALIDRSPASRLRPKMVRLSRRVENDSLAGVHGLTRALVFNAVHGVTQGWMKDLDIVGIGYRAELKGKNTWSCSRSAIHTRSNFRCLPALQRLSILSRPASPSRA